MKQVLSISFLTVLFFMSISLTEAKRRTVQDVLNNISQKSIKKKQTVIEVSEDARPRKIKRSELRSIAPPKKWNTFFKPSDQDEQELMRLLDTEINELFKLMKRYQKSANRGEIWLRLAERYMEKAKLLEYTLQKKFDEDLIKFQSQKTKRGRTPKLNLAPSKSYNKRAVKLYELFLKDFPKDSKIDQALFFLGYNYFELNQTKKGEIYYGRLVKEHRRSPYVEETYFALGEYHFENSRWASAKKYFLRITKKGKQSKFYHFSIYKLAWCEFNLGKGTRAINYLERVLMIGSASANSGNRNFDHIHLTNEATKDLIVFYSRFKNYRNAEGYFQEVLKPKDLHKSLEKLAYLYADNGNRKATRYLFKSLIASNPEDKKAFIYQREIVNVYKGFSSPVFKAELFDWISKYSKKSTWAVTNKADQKILKESEDSRESVLKNYILTVHQAAQKSKSAQNRKDAMVGYRMYLKYFNDHSEAPEMQFYFAELLYDMKRFEEASTNYLKVANAKPKHKRSNEALMNAVLALDQRLGTNNNKGRLSKSLKKVPYKTHEKRFLLITKKYLPQLKKARPDRVVNIEFKIAHTMYIHNDFNKALPGFWNIIDNYPRSEFVEPSAHIILDIHNLKKDYDGLVKVGVKLLKAPSVVSKPALRQDIQNIVEQSQFQIAQNFEKKKDYKNSAKMYASFAGKNPKSQLSSVALFNAAINFERAGDLLESIKYHRGILNRQDAKSKTNHQRSRRLLATLYEKTGQLRKAGVEFERYAKAYPKDQYVHESYYNAAILWAAFKESNRAIKNFNAYYQLPPEKANKSKRLASLVSIAEIHEKQGNEKHAYAYYEKYIKENPSDAGLVITAHVRLARIAKSLRWRKRTEEWYTKTVAVQRAYPNVGKSEAAEAKFYLLQKTYQEFLALRIPADEAKQAAVINKKLALLKTLSSKLAEVVLYDDPEYVVKAVTLTGEINEHFAKAVVEAPIPKGLNKEQAIEYRKTVDQKLAALPRKTAITNYRLAIKKASDLKVYNGSVKKAFSRLHVMQPKRFIVMKEVAIKTIKLELFDLKKNKKYAQLFAAIEDGNEGDLIDEASKLLSQNVKDGRVLNGLAIFYLQTERPGVAKIYLGKALDSDLPKPILQNNRAVVSLMEGHLKPAIDDLVQVVKDEEELLGSVATNLGYILLDHQDLVNAIRYLKVAAQTFPNDPAVLNNYAIALKHAREFDAAKEFYEKALAKDSSHIDIQLNYGRLLVEEFAEERKEQAVEILNKVKFVGSDGRASDEADNLLKQIRQ